VRSILVLALCACGGEPVAPVTPRPLRVMTYNIYFGNPNPEAVLDAIVAGDPDVVLLQEITDYWAQQLRARFALRYPHQTYFLPASGAAGYAALARVPFARDEVLDEPPGAFYPGHRLVVTTPAGPLQILHVHLRAAIDGDSWLKGYFTTKAIRSREIEAHWARLDRSLPTMVAGDLNEGVDGDVIAYLVKRGLTRIAASGPPTWRLDNNSLTADIDHVLVDDRVLAVGGSVLDVGSSDHRPVVVQVRLR
jgi:endonuclease/exonuclease/phosphatase (EEP) superfamily protein YafD